MGYVSHGLSMTIIEVRPLQKFKGAWVAFEAPGVEAEQKTVDYTCHRFEGTRAKFTHMTLAASILKPSISKRPSAPGQIGGAASGFFGLRD